MTKMYTFSQCGCSWPVLEESGDPDVLPKLDFDIERAPQDCPATFDLLGKGLTKGVFQLESRLGRRWSKKLKPTKAEHLGALSALLRPGALLAVDSEGVSMTEHYVRRRHGQEEIPSFHPKVDLILNSTFNCLVYQEQAMAIAVAVAGFTEQEADMLRKAAGKKDTNAMAKCEKMFLEGAAKLGEISDEQAKELFSYIKESQRYSFNLSHAISYGLTGYDAAYIKAHFPLAFFAGWLNNAKHKQDPFVELAELVSDARLFDVVVEPPLLTNLSKGFQTDGKAITFGLGDIKGMGPVNTDKLLQALKSAEQESGKLVKNWTWTDYLFWAGRKGKGRVGDTSSQKLIESGAMRFTGLQRQVMLAELGAWSSLTEKEQEWVGKHGPFATVVEAMKALAKPKKEGGGCHDARRVSAVRSRVELLEKPPTRLVDTPHWLAYAEEELLGIALTCSKVDGCDQSAVNCTCREFMAGRTGFLLLGVEIKEVAEMRTRKGKNPGSKMARLSLADSTCSVEGVAFPDVWKEFSHLLTPGNCVAVQAERDREGEYDSLIVKKVWQLTRVNVAR